MDAGAEGGTARDQLELVALWVARQVLMAERSRVVEVWQRGDGRVEHFPADGGFHVRRQAIDSRMRELAGSVVDGLLEDTALGSVTPT